MAVTSPDSLRTPNPGDPYNLVADLAILAQDTQDALTRRANVFNGTVAQRTAFTSTATDGMLWQDTDGIKMIWRKDSAAWVPAVWRWSGTTAQMNGFTQAPNGFEWSNTSDNVIYVRVGGAWVAQDTGWINATILAGTAGTGDSTPAYRRKNGIVYLKGMWTPTTNNQTAFSLPAGFRPFVTFYAQVERVTSVRAGVLETGEVQYIGPGGTNEIRLASFPSFPADN